MPTLPFITLNEMNRRDQLLQAMNIPQWVLAKPQVLKGDAQIRLEKAIKLVVICEEEHQTSGLFLDILRTLNLQSHEFQWLNTKQADRIAFHHQPIFWLILPPEQAVKMAKKLANQITWQNEQWQDLAQPPHKRQLWQQISAFCQHFEEQE